MASYYKRLKRDLSAAAAEGLLTPQQADAVYENLYARRLFASFKASHWISILAGLLIAGGFSMMIAHNWDRMGSVVKISGFLAAYFLVASAAIRWEEKPAVGIPAEVIWFFMPPIGIGLYAQIFQLSGDPIKPFAAWALISLPLAFFTRRRIAATLSAVLLIGVAFAGAFTRSNMFSLVKRFSSTETAFPDWTHWLWIAAVFISVFWVYFARLRPAWRDRMVGATAIWLFIALISSTFLQLHSPVFVLLAALSLSVLWLCLSDCGESPSRLPMLAWFAVVYLMTFFWRHVPRLSSYHSDSPYGVAFVWVLFAAAVALLVLKPFRPLGSGKTAELASKAALIVSMISAFLLFGATAAGGKAIAVTANVLIILAGVGLIVTGSSDSDEKRINTGVAVIFLIIVTRFLDLFGSLMRTGMAFILSGLVMAGLAYALNRTRKAIIEAANARRQHE